MSAYGMSESRSPREQGVRQAPLCSTEEQEVPGTREPHKRKSKKDSLTSGDTGNMGCC